MPHPDLPDEPAVPGPPAPDCVDLELAASPVPGPARGAHALVTLHGYPLGSVALTAQQRSVDGGVAAARAALAGQVAAHLTADGLADLAAPGRCVLAPVPTDALVTVVICSIGEDPRLTRTVASVLGQTHAHLDLVVVDNRPRTGRVRELLAGVEDPRLRIVAEPCRGLSAARNAGLAAARGDLVAYTDDDASADPGWLAWLVGPFAGRPEVVATTGLVVPDTLATPAQRLFEEFGGFDKGADRTWWSLDTPAPADLGWPVRRGTGGTLFPFSAGVYGSGNNMAFRRSWLRGSGLFDEALGAGSLTRGGEDLDAFLAVLLDGRVLVYEPGAVVRHSARATMPELVAQLYGYGSGNSAAMTRQLLAGPGRALAVARRVPSGLVRLLSPSSGKNAARSTGYPAELSRAELRGFAAGPLLYLRSRREARRRRRAYPLGG